LNDLTSEMQGFETERQKLLRMLENNVVDVKTVEEKVKYLSEQIDASRMNYQARQTGIKLTHIWIQLMRQVGATERDSSSCA